MHLNKNRKYDLELCKNHQKGFPRRRRAKLEDREERDRV